MRLGLAIDLHAPASAAAEVEWGNVREQVLEAERTGLDLVVLPDHLSYRAGDDNGYSVPDQPVGVREAVTVAAAVAAVTSTIGVGHSVINAPYRTPSMLAHIAATLADVSGGRYSLGIGVGNTFDYDQVGVAADHRVARFEECVEILASMLRDGTAHLDGDYWTANRAELAFRPVPDTRPPIVVAAGGPRTMRTAVRFGDAWNGWAPTNPDDDTVDRLLGLLETACQEVGRERSAIGTTIDLSLDPLDLAGARTRSQEMLDKLEGLGIDEARCYLNAEPTHEGRMEAIRAFGELASGN
jgi:alkanesulfonate monooxygenase SsuD/methylene tetrahydromethanopterin reductase-like flavin-dependent oxidoreductase (luciferase family)